MSKRIHKSNHSISRRKNSINEAETDISTDRDAVRRAVQTPTPQTLTPAVMMQLQRSHGNSFVQRLVATAGNIHSAPGGIQRKVSTKDWKAIRKSEIYKDHKAKAGTYVIPADNVNIAKEILAIVSLKVTEEHVKEIAKDLGLTLPDPLVLDSGPAEEEHPENKIVYVNGVDSGYVEGGLSSNLLKSLRQGLWQSRHDSNLPTRDNPGHQHIAGGSGGISFYYREDGTPVIYDYAKKRYDNKYKWQISGELTSSHSGAALG